MRKFLQWSLAAGVALVLLGTVVMQMLAGTTGRAREASVAALKEKLARLEAERAVADPAANPVPAPAGAQAETGAVEDSGPADGDDALRARWLALFDRMDALGDQCSVSPETWRASTGRLLDQHGGALREREREELTQYQACLAPVMQELLELRDNCEDLDRIFSIQFLSEDRRFLEKLWQCQERVRIHLWLDAALGDHEGVFESFSTLVYMMKVSFGGAIPRWGVDGTWNWILLKPAIESHAIDDAKWDRLLGILEAHRNQSFFYGQVGRHTEMLLLAFENWKDSPPSFKFSDAPVTYIRTWAYPRITPALFNHDMDRFSRAMNELLDLARIPYFEAKPALDRFCEDYDVESSMDELKLMRSNSGWVLVLSVSREGLEAVARQQTSMDLIRFAILLERYRRESGAYPESLDSLAEMLGGSVPLNPLMGEPYIYAPEEKTYRLGYSHEQNPYLVEEFGLNPTAVTYWHNPLGYGLGEGEAGAGE